MKNFGIYAIISNPRMLHEDVAEVLADEKIQYVQLREKNLHDRKLIALARKLKNIFLGTSTRLIINDRPDIAKIVGADGLHLGQEDMNYHDARTIAGNNMEIGLSTHNLTQLKDALLLNPSYVGFGPIYHTTTKAKPDPVVGTSLLSEALKIATVPVVAIGGIFPENIDEVLRAGAKNICMVRYFMQSESKQELKEKIHFVKQKIKEYDTNATSH